MGRDDKVERCDPQTQPSVDRQSSRHQKQKYQEESIQGFAELGAKQENLFQGGLDPQYVSAYQAQVLLLYALEGCNSS